MTADPNAPGPGEIDIETGRSAVEPEPEPIAAAGDGDPAPTAAELDGEPEPEPLGEDEPALVKKHTGAVAELIANRRELKLANARLAQIDNDPAIQRLTPEIRQAIAEGRVVVQPKPAAADLQSQALTQTAKELGLEKDGQPDLEAAARVEGWARRIANQAAAPAQHALLGQQADKNIATAVTFATEAGYDANTIAIIKATYENAKAAPNGAAMVANGEIATELWHSALGRAVSSGKFVAPKKAAAPAPGPGGAPVISEPTGRRAAASVVQLSPAVQQVYANAKLDPSKTITAQRGSVDLSKGYALED